jgi:hypothetical protein
MWFAMPKEIDEDGGREHAEKSECPDAAVPHRGEGKKKCRDCKLAQDQQVCRYGRETGRYTELSQAIALLLRVASFAIPDTANTTASRVRPSNTSIAGMALSERRALDH